MSPRLQRSIKVTFFIYLVYSILNQANAQNSDSLFLARPADTTAIVAAADTTGPTYAGVDLKTPKKAMIRSIILPGLGQAYNKQYWKIPVVYAGFGALIYAASYNADLYYTYRKAYREKIDGLPSDYPNTTPATLRQARDNARKNMELSYIALVGVYGLNVLDAFVSAHLKTFEISDDIGLRIKPDLQWQMIGMKSQPVGGIAFSFNLH